MSLRLPLRSLLAAVLVAALLSPAQSFASSYSWLIGSNGNADDPTRWSPIGVPDPAAHVDYNAPGAYTVHWNGNVPQTFRQTSWGGLVTLDLDGTHTLSELYTQFGSLTLARGAIAGPNSFGTFMNVQKGQFEVRHGASFTGGGIVGSTGVGGLNVFSGGEYHAVRGLDVREGSYVTLSGVDGTSGQPARLELPGLPLKLAGTGLVTSGGRIDATAAVQLAGGSTAANLALLQMGPGLPGTHCVLDAASDVVVGMKYGSASLPFVGRAELELNDYTDARIGGTLQVGDSISDDGCVLRMRNGATLTLDGGLRVYTTTGPGLDLRGGVAHLRTGKLRWPANRTLILSSRVGDPELWIRNGQPNGGFDMGSPLVNALVIGRGGKGTLRLSRPGTMLPVSGGIAIGDSLLGTGTLVVDSLAALEVNGAIATGTAGTGMLRVTNGAQVSAGILYAGTQEGAFGDVRVLHPGSRLTAQDNVFLGGGFAGAGGMGWLTIDSLADVNVESTSFNTSSVTVYAKGGRLTLANGGALHAGTLDARGPVLLANGSFSGGSANVAVTGEVMGGGALNCNVFSNGTLSPGGGASQLGRIVVSGSYWQLPSGRLRVHLGSTVGRRSDTLVVGTAATLSGTLAIETDASFLRVPGDTFTVLTCASRIGQFDAVTWNGNPVTGQVEVVYEPRAVRVVITASPLEVGAPLAAGVRFTATGGLRTLAFALELADAADADVALFDVTGRRLATLAAGPRPAGRHTLPVPDAATLPAGVYFARAVVRAGGVTQERSARATLLR